MKYIIPVFTVTQADTEQVIPHEKNVFFHRNFAIYLSKWELGVGCWLYLSWNIGISLDIGAFFYSECPVYLESIAIPTLIFKLKMRAWHNF